MGQNQPLELSEEEKKELSVRLLREWWLTTTQAFADNAGSEIALRHLHPYMKNNGLVAADVFHNSNHHSDNTLKDAVLGTVFWPNIIHEAEIIAKVGRQKALIQVKGCSTNGASKEACISYCQYCGGNCFEELIRREGLPSDLEWNLTKSLSFGEGFCEFMVKKEKTPNGEPLEDIACCPFSREEQLFWQLAVYGEFWVISTKAFSEWAGPEKTSEILGPYMRMSGLSIGGRLAKKAGESSINQAALTEIVSLICKVHQKSSKREECGVGMVHEISECPFSDSPMEICEQYQAFFNGICEAIDPSYEFIYDRMMTKGDKTCNWTIRKKADFSNQMSKREGVADDPIKRLTNKFIDGEISEEEYEKKMAIIKKHYPR
jgi:hypothetical protein